MTMIRSLIVSITPKTAWFLWSSSLLISFLPLGLFGSPYRRVQSAVRSTELTVDSTDAKEASSQSPNSLNPRAWEVDNDKVDQQRRSGRRQGLIGRLRNLREKVRQEAGQKVQQEGDRSVGKKNTVSDQKSQSSSPPEQNSVKGSTRNGRPQSVLENQKNRPGQGPLPRFENGPNGKRPVSPVRQAAATGGTIAFPTPAFPAPNRQAGYFSNDPPFQQSHRLDSQRRNQQRFDGFQNVASVSSPQIISQEAIVGDQFNVGHIVFRLTPADYRRWLTRSIFVDDAQGRLMYPAVVPSFMDKLENKLSENLFKEPKDVHIWFVFGGREPITVTIHGAVRHQVVMTPQSVRRFRSRRFVQSWWRNFNQMLQSQAKSSDYPPLIQAYLGCLVQQRVGLAPPAFMNKENQKPSPMKQTWELLTASENMQVSYLRDMMCGGGQDALPANVPLPQNIRWQAPIIPPVDPNTKIEPIAFVVPEECFYLRFGSWNNQIWLKKLMQEHGGDLSRMVRLRGYQSLVGDLFRDQLAMESSSLDDLLGGQVIEDVAVVGLDTFFSDGAAAGIILQSKGNTLAGSLAGKRKAFAKRNKDLGVQLQELKIDGIDATLLQSPDGRIRSYYVHISDFHCVTTSYALAVRFLQSTKGIRSLGMSEEFRYARAQMPLDRKDTIFAYLSTKFLQNVLSPHYQIEMRRRLRSITEVQTLQMATWSAESEGQQPPAGYQNWESVPVDYRIAQLITRGYLPKSFNKRPDKSKIGLLEDTTELWASRKAKKKGTRKTKSRKNAGKNSSGNRKPEKKIKKKESSLLGSFLGSIKPKSKESGTEKGKKVAPKKEKKNDQPRTIVPLIGPGSQKGNSQQEGRSQSQVEPRKGDSKVVYASTVRPFEMKTAGDLGFDNLASQVDFSWPDQNQAPQQRQQTGSGQIQQRGNGAGQRPLRRRLGNLIRNVIEDIEKGAQQNQGNISGQNGNYNGPNRGHFGSQPGSHQPGARPRPIGPGWSIAPKNSPYPGGNSFPPGSRAPGPLVGSGVQNGVGSGLLQQQAIVGKTNSVIRRVESRPVGKFLYGDTLRGVRGWMLPIADTAIGSVTQEESLWYQQQAAYFEKEWKRADPIMIGVKRFRFKEKVERVVFDGRIAPFGGESLSWITDNIGAPMEVTPVKNPEDVIRFQASIREGAIFPGTGAHQLMAAIQRDARSLHSVDPSEWWTTFKLIKDTPGYIASWPTAGMLDYLPMLGGQPDNEGFTHSIGRKIWRLQSNGFSVVAMDKERLRRMKPFLQVTPSKRPAQARLEVADLANSQLADWANTLWKQRSWQSSVANVRLLHLLMQFFHLPPGQAKQKAQSLLNAKLVCSLGGTYQLVGPNVPMNNGLQNNPSADDQTFLRNDFVWQSSHWPVRSKVPAGQIPGGQSPLLKWFRGALLEVSHRDNRFLIHGYLDIQRHEAEQAALPSFNLFKGFNF